MITFDTYLADADETCIEYEFAVASFSPGRPSRSGHPLDPSGWGAEVDLAEDVAVYIDGDHVATFGLDSAIAAIAASRDWTLDRARSELEELAWQQACEEAAEQDEDARAQWEMDRAEGWL